MPLFSKYNGDLHFANGWDTFLLIAQIDRPVSSTFEFFRTTRHHFESARLLSMAGHTSEDTPADTPEDTPVAAQFPEQPYRDKSASSSSDDSDSEPTSK